MRKRGHRLLGSILLFIMVQVAWFALLGIWIYWFVASYITFTQISERYYPKIQFNSQNIIALVGGIVLLMGVSGGISVLFGKLRRQVRITRMYDSFIANITHELKSPLASIQIHLETLLTRKLPEKTSDEFLRLMLRDTDRLEKHISSILQVAGIEDPRYAIQLTSTPAENLFTVLFKNAADQFGVPPERRHVEGNAPCMVRVDERTMKIVVDNLVDNAVKYSIDVPEITLVMACQRRWVTVSISDSGIGISPQDQKLVFRKFVRLSNPENPSVKGTGLGLYWIREIVRHHNGKVHVESEGAGTGSTFVIELPVDRRQIWPKNRKRKELP